jgi:hypothetical protein
VTALKPFANDATVGESPYDSVNISMLDDERDQFLEALDSRLWLIGGACR